MHEGALSARPRACAAGPRSPRRRSSPATCCSPSTSARGCTSATSRRPARSRSSAGPRPRGIAVTAEVTPHHLLLTDELAAHATTRSTRSTRRCAPPPTSQALREALADGTIDSSPPTTRRTPSEDKDCEWAAAALGHARAARRRCRWSQQTMVEPGLLDWARRRDRMSARPGPDRPARRPGPARSRSGEPANLVLVDPDARWTVDPAATWPPRSRNTPYAGRELPGRGRRDVPARAGRPSWTAAARVMPGATPSRPTSRRLGCAPRSCSRSSRGPRAASPAGRGMWRGWRRRAPRQCRV